MGNEELLNNLEEGVIIQHQDTNEIVFLNTAAQKFKQCEDLSNYNISLLGEQKLDMLDMDLQMFAHIDTELFKETTIDAASTIERIKAVNNYKTLDEII